MIAIFPFLLMLIGLLMWALCNAAIPKDAGRGAFFIGLFFVTARLSNETIKLF